MSLIGLAHLSRALASLSRRPFVVAGGSREGEGAESCGDSLDSGKPRPVDRPKMDVNAMRSKSCMVQRERNQFQAGGRAMARCQ